VVYGILFFIINALCVNKHKKKRTNDKFDTIADMFLTINNNITMLGKPLSKDALEFLNPGTDEMSLFSKLPSEKDIYDHRWDLVTTRSMIMSLGLDKEVVWYFHNMVESYKSVMAGTETLKETNLDNVEVDSLSPSVLFATLATINRITKGL